MGRKKRLIQKKGEVKRFLDAGDRFVEIRILESDKIKLFAMRRISEDYTDLINRFLAPIDISTYGDKKIISKKYKESIKKGIRKK